MTPDEEFCTERVRDHLMRALDEISQIETEGPLRDVSADLVQCMIKITDEQQEQIPLPPWKKVADLVYEKEFVEFFTQNCPNSLRSQIILQLQQALKHQHGETSYSKIRMMIAEIIQPEDFASRAPKIFWRHILPHWKSLHILVEDKRFLADLTHGCSPELRHQTGLLLKQAFLEKDNPGYDSIPDLIDQIAQPASFIARANTRFCQAVHRMQVLQQNPSA